jgi:hypothetical protein
MIADTSVSAQYAMNKRTGEVGLVQGLVLSPYTFEAMDKVQRVHVTRRIGGGNGKMFEASDYWRPQDCIALPNAFTHVGASVTFVTKHGVRQEGVVLSVESNQLCAMLPSGRTGWVFFKYVVSVGSPLAASPLTNSATAIA